MHNPILPASCLWIEWLFQWFNGLVRIDNRLLVKVPGDEHTIVTLTSAGQWHFRHITAAPHERDRHRRFFVGQWYVAWRQGLFPKGLGPARWDQARGLTPELADAAHVAFGVYPLIIEHTGIEG